MPTPFPGMDPYLEQIGLWPDADLFVFSIRQQIPVFELLLQEDDEEPLVEINRLLHQLYDRAGYDLRIDYPGEPEIPLNGEDAAWAEKLPGESCA